MEMLGTKGEYPIADLVSTLWPAAIVCSVKPFDGLDKHRYTPLVDKPRTPKPLHYDGPIIRAFDGSSRPQGGYWNEQPAESWLDDLAKLLARK